MILREQLVKFSLQQLIAEKLPEFGYVTEGAGQTLELRNAFPTPNERAEELKITTLAYGFDIDDGGEMMELGSTLTRYVHTFTAWVFALEPEFGEQVAHSIKHILRRSDDVIPIYDYNEAGNPQIDEDLILKVQTQHQGNNSTRPWDRYVFTTAVKIQDAYYIT
jgi:hypothetical protein